MTELPTPPLWRRGFSFLGAAYHRLQTTIRTILFKLGRREDGLGKVSEYHLAIVGKNIGFRPTAMRRLFDDFAPANGMTVRLAEADEETLTSLTGRSADGQPLRSIV